MTRIYEGREPLNGKVTIITEDTRDAAMLHVAGDGAPVKVVYEFDTPEYPQDLADDFIEHVLSIMKAYDGYNLTVTEHMAVVADGFPE